ncbi:MarR family transcriptional regulator [Lysinibacillus contaminans]|uniref:MarR family transcriptional regulator n=1 Tax=Lysinibacillus contaminans TaxID=1293441 RepID=A0ABR5K1P6_9BACI|nr:MarR family winged helix-turn-helix transcriptional regulator [Lysinibacillus contaminans]KOS68665.1 MarR family transcriptional regulator [Lysinibacillus contaminans]
MVEDDVQEQLVKIGAKMRKDYSDALRDINIHVGQDRALCQLWKEDGITQVQLSERISCEPPTVSNMVKKLEDYGLVQRSRDKHDARISRVYLTERGREIQAPVSEIWNKQQEKLLQGIQQDELFLVRRILQQMLQNLT